MSSGPATSFQKKARGKIIQIPGTKPSLHNNQLLVSTGIPSLDNLLGGGIAVGTVVLVEQDTYGSYSRLMLKYFCAEAIMCKHHLLLASADTDPSNIIKELPGPIFDDPGSEVAQGGEAGDDPLKIAWRYQHLPQVQPGVSGSKFGHYYDLTKTMDATILDTAPKSLHYIEDEDSNSDSGKNEVMRPGYCKLLRLIRDQIEGGQFGTATTQPPTQQQRNILRIGIESLGSPLWGEMGGIKADQSYDPSLPRFLYALRSLMRSAFASCIITMPTHLFHDNGFIHRIERLCDTVLHLESFVGDSRETNAVYSQYHGIFNIRRLPILNTLMCHMPDTLDLAFKLKRKKFMIEKLHLPPELSETASRSEEDPLKPNLAQATACSSSVGGAPNKLDF